MTAVLLVTAGLLEIAATAFGVAGRPRGFWALQCASFAVQSAFWLALGSIPGAVAAAVLTAGCCLTWRCEQRKRERAS